MKKINTSKSKFITANCLLFILWIASTLYVHAQINYSSSTRKPGNVGYIKNSGGEGQYRNAAGRVVIFNPDGSRTTNENFYVSYTNNWWPNVKFEVQREGGAGTRNGMFMDTGHLYLIGDWDNNSNSENIIFGFNSNLRSRVSEKMRLTQNGFLALGTTTPKGMLHVNGDTYSKGHVYLYAYEGDGNSGTAYLQARDKSNSSNIGLQLRTQNVGNIVNALKINPNGNVGIGTTDPEQKLHVDGNTKINGSIQTNGNTYSKGNLSLFANEGENQSGTAYLQAKDESGRSSIGFQLRSQNTGNFINALKINPNGNIGVGTTEPTEKLEIQGNIKTSTGSAILLQKGVLSDQEGLYLIGDRDNTSENEDIIFGFDGNSRESIQEKMRLTDEGYLGIGTNTPSEKLEVLGKIKASSSVTSLQSFPDYVFEKDYKLQPLIEVKKYVEAHHHLPGMPSEKEVLKNGLDIREIAVLSVEKIEELFLHTITQQTIIEEQKEITAKQQSFMISQQEIIKKLEQRIANLERSR
ncbi:hypothetical protein [Aquimarina aggregata]|uniref:hypothetical protein n=1 Tax=Aquimarina aggregata TaxID=1642818 RepID=UPI00249018A0|nr:hypothetical protein [Aquimarina aggregata]